MDALSQSLREAALFEAGGLLMLLVACVVVEYVSPRETTPLRSRLPGAFFSVLQPILCVFVALPMQQAWGAMGVRPLVQLTALPWALRVVLVVCFLDLLRYLEHRIQHRFWWPVHAVHHSPTVLNATNGYTHPLQKVTEIAFIATPMSLVGFGDAALPLWSSFAFSMQALLIHSPLRVNVGPLRRVLVDGPYHRIHHSIEPRHFDKNFGVVFTVWDQLFGTAHFPADDEWPAVGVLGSPPPTSLKSYLAMPFRELKPRRWLAKASIPGIHCSTSRSP